MTYALSLRYEACVRARSLASSCTTCSDVCPTHAITLDGVRGSVVIRTEACTGCGLCAAACPTDAFTATFDLPAFLARSDGDVRCGRDGLPCVGALSAEDLVVLGLRVGNLVVRGDICGSPSGHGYAEQRVREAQALLGALGAAAHVAWAPPVAPPAGAAQAPRARSRAAEVAPSRRRLLRIFAPQLEPPPPKRVTQPDRLDRSQLRATGARRRRLLAALSSPDQTVSSVPEGLLSFLSSKVISEDACTSCSMCMNVCPTGALVATRVPGEIAFDTRACVKCRLCHDVCEPKAISLSPETVLADLFATAPRRLVRVGVSHCVDCGVPYKKPAGDRGMCPRCNEQDLEARELTGVAE